MIPNYHNNSWKKFNSRGGNYGFDIPDDGSYVRIYDENPNASLKKIMYTVDIAEDKTYTLLVPYEIKYVKHESMVYGIISLCNKEGKSTRRLYLDKNSEQMFKTFESQNETKVTVELGIKCFGNVYFYPPKLQEGGAVKKKNIKLSAVNLKVVDGKSYEENLERIGKSFDKAADMGADIVCFAETMNDRGMGLALDEQFEPLDGKYCSLMKQHAKEKGVFAFFTFHELDSSGVRRNTAVLIDRKGEIAGTYSKTHLTIGEYEKGMVPGSDYTVFDTEIGKIGMLVCWDAYFPEVARSMALKGAEILLISTAGNPTYRHIARAKENGVYVVVACCGETDAGIEPTKIINPKGDIISQSGEDEGVAFAEIDIYDEKNRNIYCLSVGDAWAEPNNIYLNELRRDLL